MNSSIPKVLVVGGGLAGVLSALELSSKLCSVTLCISSQPSAATVAAGLSNPITGKRFHFNSLFNEYFAVSKKMFSSLDAFSQLPILRVLSSAQESAKWKSRTEFHYAEQTANSNQIHQHFPELRDNILATIDNCKSEFGTFWIKNSGRVRADIALANAMNLLELQTNVELLNENVDYSDVEMHPFPLWKGRKFDAILFTEGWLIQDNPFAKHITLMPAKGEILTVNIPALNPPLVPVIYKGRYLVHDENTTYRFGATYMWNEINCVPTESAVELLSSELRELINVPFTVFDHKANVRPIVQDLKPIVGQHPKYPSLYFLNGVGSKGILYTPLLAKKIAEFIINGVNTIPPEFDIQRYKLSE